MQKIQQEFDKHFSKYKDHNIAIYGTGNNAKILIEGVKGYKFVNLVSKDCIGQVVYGKTVISLEEALKTASMMIIAATPSSTAIVYERIKELVPEQYPVFDMTGNRLEGMERYKNNAYWDCNLEQLQNAIKGYDVISFDIFDTLITRTVLEPKDVFDMVEERLRLDGIDLPYVRWRISAEEWCNEYIEAPSINQIYEVFQNQNSLTKELTEKIKKLEYETELSLIVPRTVMKEVLEWTISIGKKVYLTSDMYFSKGEIQQFLVKANIHTDDTMLISSEVGKSKAKGDLFSHLLDLTKTKSILHIGDNYECDINMAHNYGIDTYYVKRGYDILIESSCCFLLDQIRTKDDRRLLGYLVAELCNNPFELSASKGKICVRDYRDLACILLPMTVLFMSEIVKNSEKYDRLLFASRDGFFLNELYKDICKWENQLPPGIYFYASRSAMSSASVFSVKDIEVLSSKLKEDLNQNLKHFFNLQFHVEVPDMLDITVGEAIDRCGSEGLSEELKKYSNKIISKSQVCRERYKKYIQALGIGDNEKLAIVDIITQGTLVYGLTNLMGNNIGLVALGTSWIPNKYISDIKQVSSVYGNVYVKVGDVIYSQSALNELHLFLEMLYSSTEGQLYEFDQDGKPIFVDGTKYDEKLVMNTQTQIRNMLKEIDQKYYNMDVSKELALECLKILYRMYSEMSSTLKSSFEFDDPYDVQLRGCNLIDSLSM